MIPERGPCLEKNQGLPDAGERPTVRSVTTLHETLSTHPDVQGRGRATRVLADAIAAEVARGTTVVFLDVAADNVAARALYDRAGFSVVAERKNYYAGRRTALIMRRDL